MISAALRAGDADRQHLFRAREERALTDAAPGELRVAYRAIQRVSTAIAP
jgi:hypothetical protein